MNSGNAFKPLNVEKWNKFVVEHAGLKHYAAMIERPGSLVLASAVEYLHFAPETAENQNYHINFVDWQMAAWSVFSVPSSRHNNVVKTAQALAMNVCRGTPSMMFLGQSAMLMTTSPSTNEIELKSKLIKVGVPPGLVNAFKGLEMFPGPAGSVHAIENNPKILTRPLEPSELSDLRKREQHIIEAMSHGSRPSLREIADYVYGKGRIRPTPV